MPTAFVTGANGFLGAHLVRELLHRGTRVRALMRPHSDDRLLQNLVIERITGDVLHPDTYRPALDGCDTVFHVAAAYTHDPAHIADMERVNRHGAEAVLMAAVAAGASHIVHTSTIGTIGQPPPPQVATEDSPYPLPDPTPYARSKLAGEQVAAQLAADGAPIVIVHPVAMLGTGDWRPSASGRLVLAFLQKQTLSYLPGGINWCPVTDVARGMILAAERGQPGRHYILGHAHGNLDEAAFRNLLSQASGLPPYPPQPRSQRLRRQLGRWRRRPQAPSAPATGHPPARLTCDPSRAVTELGMPQSDLTAAASAGIRWYRQHGFVS
ncbi:MAG: NAD-dependent epimerase/dehydratase family protein [Chloroflexi bacterium]|nr:NAD-dependent epimerase/dehydratase family protein [Chloroflexota bacterium]